ncbi:hypothetical protein SAMN02982929_05745 [Saccharopolyspora kobensis]|uniref:Uncharacterized protein n=1 Tax=Saccharopolyspora kobensis TaxID=146035 RepID=A0A1H6E7A1_9PSEU|nr:hypothetical protein [Saccharopolyspora kobensis]SEG93133.1 hypothetical protein SAMN02982929_05745 [Saccharopolyspora kobensis]SFD42973.1 hypothetical protein SAMN05216506_104274 [Saccharopolyspora kobensis]
MTLIAFSDDEHEHELDAHRPDLGHPGKFQRERFRPHRANPYRRYARCIERHPVYLRRNPGSGRGFHWSHLAGRTCSHPVPPEPSDRQVRQMLRGRAARAFNKAGNERRSSVLRFECPDGTRFTLRVQIRGAAQRAVPCVRLIRPARNQRRDIAEIEVFVTGVVHPSWEDCGRGGQCWRRRLCGTDRCPGHLRWRATVHDEEVVSPTTSRYAGRAAMLGIDTFAERITTGELVIVDAPRDDRADTFPVISTPAGAAQATRYGAELAQWRDRSAIDRMAHRARKIAAGRRSLVRIVPDVDRFLDQLALPGTTVVTGEVFLVPTESDRDRIAAAGAAREWSRRLRAVIAMPFGY